MLGSKNDVPALAHFPEGKIPVSKTTPTGRDVDMFKRQVLLGADAIAD